MNERAEKLFELMVEKQKTVGATEAFHLNPLVVETGITSVEDLRQAVDYLSTILNRLIEVTPPTSAWHTPNSLWDRRGSDPAFMTLTTRIEARLTINGWAEANKRQHEANQRALTQQQLNDFQDAVVRSKDALRIANDGLTLNKATKERADWSLAVSLVAFLVALGKLIYDTWGG